MIVQTDTRVKWGSTGRDAARQQHASVNSLRPWLMFVITIHLTQHWEWNVWHWWPISLLFPPVITIIHHPRDFDRCSVTRGGNGGEEFCDISVITQWNILLSRTVISTATPRPHGPFHQHMRFYISQLPPLILHRLLPKVSIKSLISYRSTPPRLNWLVNKYIYKQQTACHAPTFNSAAVWYSFQYSDIVSRSVCVCNSIHTAYYLWDIGVEGDGGAIFSWPGCPWTQGGGQRDRCRPAIMEE